MDATARDFFQSCPADTKGLEDLFREPQDSVLDSMSVPDAAKLLGVDRRSVVRLLAWKKIDGTKDRRGRWLVNRQSVLDRLDSVQRESGSVLDSVQLESGSVLDSVQLESGSVLDSVQLESGGVLDSVQLESGGVLDSVQLENASHFKIQKGEMILIDSHRENHANTQCEAVTTTDSELAKAFKEMAHQLQHATYRNGWLESKLEEVQKERDQAVKLLTDSQQKTKWWQKIRSWLTGQ